MKFMRRYTDYFFWIVLLLLLVGLGYVGVLFISLYKGTDLFLSSLNSFFGAFFALITLGIASLIGKYLSGRVKHYNSLVNLETELNEILGIVNDNIYLLSGFEKTVSKGDIYWSPLKLIPLNKKHFQELQDIEFMNELFGYYYSIRRLNDDTENAMKSYSEIKDAYIHKLIGVEQYILNSMLVSKQLKVLEDFSSKLEDETIDLLAKVRIMMRTDRPITTRILQFINADSSKTITVHELSDEKKKIKKELKESSEKEDTIKD